MGDEYFGYTTNGNKSLVLARRMAARMGEDIRYYPDQSSGDYIESTVNWKDPHFNSTDESNAAYRNDSIELIYKRIMAQDAGMVQQLADQWYRVTQVIDDISGRVRKAAEGLSYGSDGTPDGKGGWTGAGADAFLARGPGGTLKSLDDWQDAAHVNWMGTLSLSYAITRYKSEMVALWEDYKRAMVQASNAWWDRNSSNYVLEGKPHSLESLAGAGEYLQQDYVTSLRITENTWSKKAQQIQWAMAQEYWSIMSEDFAGGRASVYEGPTDAVQENPAFVARALAPNIPRPNVTPPTVGQNLVARPGVSAPNVNATAPDRTGLHAGRPDVAAPDVNVSTGAPGETVGVPPVAPVVPVAPVAPIGRPGVGAPTARMGPAPTAPDGSRLLSNLPNEKVAGVLRPGQAEAQLSGERLPPAPPQSTAKPPPSPPSQIRGRGTGQGVPGAPFGKHGSGESAPPANAAPGRPVHTADQFGAPPSAPSSPVLRGPQTATPQIPGGGPRRGAPASPAAARDPHVRSGQPGVPQAPMRGDAAPPVLHRPRPASPEKAAPPNAAASRDASASDFAPPTPPSTRPVVGRPARPAPGAPEATRPATGVVRGTRRAGPTGYQAEITSRKRSQEKPQRSTVDQEFDKIQQLLAKEDAWTVETPGGGVLDSTPARPVTSATEPKPTVGM